jgi:multiple sugar transport system permease protein
MQGWLLVLPTVILLVVLIAYPIGFAFYLSMQDLYLLRGFDTSKFVGLKNFIDFLSNPDTPRYFLNTFMWVAGTVLGELTIALGVALLLNRSFRGRGLIRGLILVPWVLSPVVAGVIWRWILDGQWGVLNHILMKVGLIAKPLQWLSDPNLVWISLIGVTIWKAFPFACVNILAALQVIPPELYEAAAIDGSNSWQAFKEVTFPLIKPVLTTVGLLLTIWRTNEFNMIWVMTQGGPGITTTTLSVHTYLQSFRYYRVSMGASIGVLLMIFLFFLTTIYVKRTQMEW